MRRFPKHPASAKDQAIEEILTGAAYCIENNLKISAALSSNFDMSNPCIGMIAKNTRSKRYHEGLTELGMSETDSRRCGFACSPEFYAIMNRNFMLDLCWMRIYNHLWRATGLFFKEHPEFGAR